MRIFLPIWGSGYIELFEKALAMSLRWPRNNEAIKDAKWIVITDDETTLNAVGKIIREITPLPKFDVPSKEDLLNRVEGVVAPNLSAPGMDSGMILIEAFKYAAKLCLKENIPLLIATPDFIYGDGTINVFKQIANGPGLCASIAHIRVIPHILGDLKAEDPPSNQRLMRLAWNKPHASWSNNEVGKKPGMLHKGGIQWWRMSDTLAAVQHYMPSPFFCNFLGEDLEHFKEVDDRMPPGFGIIDHLWPTHLLQKGRIRFIGDSDIAMMVEITEAHKNVPPFNTEDDPQNEFMHTKFHNNIFKQFISGFRAEKE